MIDATKEGEEEWPQKALYTISESPSMMKSWIPTSFANWRHLQIKAFALASKAPKGALIFLLNAATTCPWESQIRTPTPTASWALKVALSTLILHLNIGGGDHPTTWIIGVIVGRQFAALYSSKYYIVHCTKATPLFLLPLCLTSFLLNHMDHAIVTTIATLSSSYESGISRFHIKSKSDLMLDGSKTKWSLVHCHTSLASG